MKKLRILFIVCILVPLMMLLTACGGTGAKGDTGPQGIQGPKGDPGTQAARPDTYLFINTCLVIMDGETGAVKSITSVWDLERYDDLIIIPLGDTLIGYDTSTDYAAEINYNYHITDDVNIEFFVVGDTAYIFEHTKIRTAPYTYEFDYIFSHSEPLAVINRDAQGRSTIGCFPYDYYIYICKNGVLDEILDASRFKAVDSVYLGRDYYNDIYCAFYKDYAVFVDEDGYFVSIPEIYEIAGTKFFAFPNYDEDGDYISSTIYVLEDGALAAYEAYAVEGIEFFVYNNGCAYINGIWNYAYQLMELDNGLFAFLHEEYVFIFTEDSGDYVYCGLEYLVTATDDGYGYPVKEFFINDDMMYMFNLGVYDTAIDLNEELTEFTPNMWFLEYDGIAYIFDDTWEFDYLAEIYEFAGIRMFEGQNVIYIIEDNGTCVESSPQFGSNMYFFVYDGNVYIWDENLYGMNDGGFVDKAYSIYGDYADMSAFVYKSWVWVWDDDLEEDVFKCISFGYVMENGWLKDTLNVYEFEDICYFEIHIDSVGYETYIVDGDGRITADYIQVNINGIYFIVHDSAVYVVYDDDYMGVKCELVNNEFTYKDITYIYDGEFWSIKPAS